MKLEPHRLYSLLIQSTDEIHDNSFLFYKITFNFDFIIAIFDDFSEQLSKDSKTIVILDNAPTHKSNLFQDKI